MELKPLDREQRWLLPPSIGDFVSASHRVRLIVDVVERLELSEFTVGGGETGRPAYPATALLALLLYGFSEGVFSSRELARRCETDCAFMFAAGALKPSYRTISRFRAQNEDALSEIFTQVLLVCRQMGIGDLGIVAIDGSSQKASASLDAHDRKEHLEKQLLQTRAQMATLLNKAAEVDAAEEHASTDDDDEPPALASKKKRVKAIEAALKELDLANALERNTTDPDARLQRFKEGSRPGYTTQIAVSEDGVILACDVDSRAGDTHQLVPMVDAVHDNLGQYPGVVVADGGYESGENFAQLVDRDVDAVVGSASAKSAYRTKAKTEKYQWIDFEHDPINDEYVCPPGKRLVRLRKKNGGSTTHASYRGIECSDCSVRSHCTAKPVKTLRVLQTLPFLKAMALRREHDRRHGHLLRRRKALVEGHFGHFKHNLRWRQFTRRGLEACRSEFRLLCATFNLLKLAASHGNRLATAHPT